MRTIISLVTLLNSMTGMGPTTLDIIGPCSETPVYSIQKPANLTAGKSVGALTLALLAERSIPFIGSEAGMNSILNTPTGDAAIEVVGSEEIRAYGWCYEVDGLQPDLMPGQYRLEGGERVRWFYAYSLSRRGEWVSYCEPAYLVKPPGLCASAR